MAVRAPDATLRPRAAEVKWTFGRPVVLDVMGGGSSRQSRPIHRNCCSLGRN